MTITIGNEAFCHSHSHSHMSQLLTQLIGAKPSFDIILVGVLFGAAILYGFFAGRNKLVIAIIATYLALVIFPVLPYTQTLKASVDPERAFAVDIGVFLGLTVIFYFLLKRSVVRTALRTPKMGDGGFLQVAIFSVLAAGLILAYSYSFLPPLLKKESSPFLRRFLFSDDARFWWTIVPLAGLLLIRKRETEK